MVKNINRLQRYDELELFMQIQKIHIYLTSEIHFTRDFCNRLRNYNIYHSIHVMDKAREGSATIIKHIKHNGELSIEIEEIPIRLGKQHLKISAIHPSRYNLKAK